MKKTLTQIMVLSLGAIALSGCGPVADATSGNSTSANTSVNACTDLTDYSSQVHLALDYKGHNFLTDGIGQVILNVNIDGDTTHFYQAKADGTADKSSPIASRYLCIDTPESTGQVEPWGKAAAKFTASQINAAKVIVISSESSGYAAPAHDSNGTRWMSYVWVSSIENPTLNDFKLLNIMIVRNGYSYSTAGSSSLYYSAFAATQKQANCEAKNIYSSEKDPDYVYSGGTKTTLQLIKLGKKYDKDTDSYVDYDWFNSSNNKVSFPCTVAMDCGSSSYVYDDIASLDDPTVTIRYSMYIYIGSGSAEPLSHVGWRLNVVGWLSIFNGTVELTGASYTSLYPGADSITILDQTSTTYTPAVLSVSEASADAHVSEVITIKSLHGLAAGSYTSKTSSGGVSLTIKCADSAGNSLYLYFLKGVLTDRNDRSRDIGETNYESYLCGADSFDVTAPLTKYTTSSGKVMYELALQHNADLVFNG
jgi:endonuclease YncB( thermonuclease family)